MARGRKQVRLGVILKETGSHVAGWRHPSVPLAFGEELERFIQIAQIAEQAKMDFVFVADSPSVSYQFQPEMLERVPLIYHLEPLTLLSVIAPFTQHIGLVGTMSTSFNEPYNVARMFGSLDHLSKGRASWNVVTTTNDQAAPNFGLDKLPPKPERYERASEFIDIVRALWDSWEDDAILKDRDTGIFLDPSKMHFLNHSSVRFAVRGPLNVTRTPQGQPVVFVAASSAEGRELGARTADAMFMAQLGFESARASYRDVKSRMETYGRNPDDLSIVLGAAFIVGRTEADARAKYDFLQSRIDVSLGVHYLSYLAQEDMSRYPLDEPLPPHLLGDKARSRLSIVVETAVREGLTLRQTALRYADGFGHFSAVGSGQEITDLIEHWVMNEATDGFALRVPYFPEALEDFNELVIPELQRRGLYRTAYSGTTFRDNLGLPRPAHKVPNLHIRHRDAAHPLDPTAVSA